jgi:outer membrane protein TolC
LWGGNKGQTEKAAAEQLSQQVNYETATREVMFEVYQAFLEAQLAEAQVKLYKKSLEEAGEMLRLAQLHYDEGKLDLVGYLDQIRTAKDTKQQYYERLFELTQSITKLESIVYISIRKEGYLQ